MNQLIAYFEYNGDFFSISLLDKKRIVFFKKDNKGNICNNLSPSEYKAMKQVYNSLRVDPDKSIFIKNINVSKNIYRLFYDSNSDNYFWTLVAGEYNEKENLFLNFRYNHQPDILFSGLGYNKAPNSAPYFYSRLVKIGQKIVNVFVAATLSLNLLAGCTVVEPNISEPTEVIVEQIETTTGATIETTEDYTEESTENKVEEKREYNWEDIRQAVENNTNLSNEDKNIILSLKFVFDKDYKYMDLDMIIKKLGTLQILYGFTEEELRASGTYEPTLNIIKIAAPNFDEANIGTVVHEIGHVLQTLESRSFLVEWSNAKWTREVLWYLYTNNSIDKKLFLSSYGKERYDNGEFSFEEDPEYFLKLCSDSFAGGYNPYIPLYCVLGDLVTPETLSYCHYNPARMGIIVDDLLRIGTPSSGGQPTKNDISNACAVINSIDDLRTWDYFIWDYQYSYDFSEVLTLLDYFYIEKYGSSIKDNPEYHIIFSTYFGSCKTGGYFADSQSNLQNFLEDDYFQKYGSYSKPGIFLVEPCFGYYSSANILAYTKETVPIDDTLIYKFEIYMTETKMNSSGKSH